MNAPGTRTHYSPNNSNTNLLVVGFVQILALAFPIQGNIAGLVTIPMPIIYFTVPIVSLYLFLTLSAAKIPITTPKLLLLFVAMPLALCGL